jgi:hypothetical protein
LEKLEAQLETLLGVLPEIHLEEEVRWETRLEDHLEEEHSYH